MSVSPDVYVELTRRISSQPTVSAALRVLTTAVVVHVQAADAAAVIVPNANQFQTVAATSGLPVAVDTLQHEHGGPSLAAIVESETQLLVDDLTADVRWPKFAAAATNKTSVRSMLACRLYLDPDEPLGSLSLYSRTPRAFAPDAARTTELLAAHGAPAIALVRTRETVTNLQKALESSRIIGAAMGVLMTTRLITPDEAFDLLRAASQSRHRKLRDIAHDVVLTGTLAGEPSGNTQHRPATTYRVDGVYGVPAPR